jgi:hypothetical protein
MGESNTAPNLNIILKNNKKANKNTSNKDSSPIYRSALAAFRSAGEQ